MKLESNCVNSECDVYDSCDKFSEQSEYKYCAGINEAMYKEYNQSKQPKNESC